MTRILIAAVSGIALMSVAACSDSDDTTTQSIEPAPTTTQDVPPVSNAQPRVTPQVNAPGDAPGGIEPAPEQNTIQQ